MNASSNGEWNTINETSTKSVEKPGNVITRRKIVGIYGLRNKITNKWYIGQSVNIQMRLSCYKHLKCKSQPKIYRALLKYGFDSFDFRIIEMCSDNTSQDLMDKKEVGWIKYYNSVVNGYNTQFGGHTSKQSASTIEKCRTYASGRTHSEETKKKIRDRLTGMVYDEIRRNNMCVAQRKRFSSGEKVGNTETAAIVNKTKKLNYLHYIIPIIRRIERNGVKSRIEMSSILTSEGVLTIKGNSTWTKITINSVMKSYRKAVKNGEMEIIP